MTRHLATVRRLIPLVLPLLLVLLPACAAVEPTPTPTAVSVAATATATPVPTATAIPTATPVPLPTLSLWVGELPEQYAVLEPILRDAGERAGVVLQIEQRDPDGLRAGIALADQLGDPLPQLLWADQHTLAALAVEQRLRSWNAEFITGTLGGLRQWGSTYGAPITAQHLLLLYRLPDMPAPTSAAELRDLAQAAILPARAGMVQGWGALAWFYPWYRALGGELVDDQDQPTLDNEAFAATVTLLRGFYDSAPRNGDTLDRGRRLLAGGQTAYSIDSDAAWPTLSTLSETLQVEISALPPLSDGTPAWSLIGGSYLMAFDEIETAQWEAAQRFAEELQREDVQLALSAALQRLPVRAELHTDPAIQQDPLLRAMAAAARWSDGLAPTQGVRCASFAIEVYLYGAISADRPPAELGATVQGEAEYCLRLAEAEQRP